MNEKPCMWLIGIRCLLGASKPPEWTWNLNWQVYCQCLVCLCPANTKHHPHPLPLPSCLISHRSTNKLPQDVANTTHESSTQHNPYAQSYKTFQFHPLLGLAESAPEEAPVLMGHHCPAATIWVYPLHPHSLLAYCQVAGPLPDIIALPGWSAKYTWYDSFGRRLQVSPPLLCHYSKHWFAMQIPPFHPQVISCALHAFVCHPLFLFYFKTNISVCGRLVSPACTEPWPPSLRVDVCFLLTSLAKKD